MIERLRVRIPAGAVGEFSSPQSTLCADSLFGVRSIPVLSQWHVQDPGHSAKSAGGRLHLNTHTPLTHRSRSGLTMPLSRQSVGTYQETSSHATRQGALGHNRLSSLSQWTDPGLKSGISVLELISTSKKKKKKKKRKRRRLGKYCRTFSQTPRTRGKSHHHHQLVVS